MALFVVDEGKLPCNNIICYIKIYHSEVSTLFYKPLFIASVITLTLPIVNAVIDLFKKFIKKKRDFLLTEYIDNKIPSSPQAYVSLKKELEDLKNDYYKSIQDAQELRVTNETLNKEKGFFNQQKESQQEIITQLTFLKNDKLVLTQSGERTMYIKDSKTSTSAIAITNDFHKDWDTSLRAYDSHLNGAFWIAHQYPIDNQEAISGLTYTFYDSFEISSLEVFSSIMVYCLVDDFISIKINGKIARNRLGQEESIGFSTLHEYDILELCKVGSNDIQFFVRNRAMTDLIEQTGSNRQLGLINPYGLVFKVIAISNK